MSKNLRYCDNPDDGWFYCKDYVTEPLEVLYDGNLINVDDFVHVVCGKVICWNKEDLPLDDEFIKNIIDFARDSLYKKPSQPRMSGHGSVLFLVKCKSSDQPKAVFVATDYHINELPDVLRHNIKLCCPYYEEHGL